MISRRNLLKKLNWKKQIDLNLDLTEYDDTLDTMIEKYASPEDLKALCKLFNVAFVKEDGFKTSKQELLIVFHNEPGLTALVVGPLLLGIGVYLFAGTMAAASILAKLSGLTSLYVGDKLLNLSSKYSEENIKQCRVIMSRILSTMPKKVVLKEIKEITVDKPADKKGGTRRKRKRR